MPDTTGDPAGSDDRGRTRPFADVLLEHDKGRTHTELSTGLQDLIAAVLDTQKAGSLALTVKVVPDKADGMVRVAVAVALKRPQRARESLFYVDDDHNLSRKDPRQTELPLRGLPGSGSSTDRTDRTEATAR